MKWVLALCLCAGMGCADTPIVQRETPDLPPQTKDNEAALFRNMTQKLLDAKTVSAKLAIRKVHKIPGKPDLTFEAEVRLHLADGNSRVQMTEAFEQGPAKGKSRHEVLTNGNEMRFYHLFFPDLLKENWRSQTTPSGWRESLLKGLATLDFHSGYTILGSPGGKFPQSVRTDDTEPPTAFKLNGKEIIDGEEAYKLEYSVTRRANVAERGPYRCTVWISVKHNLPVKRVKKYSWMRSPRQITVIETFEVLALDEEIDPKTFDFPKQ